MAHENECCSASQFELAGDALSLRVGVIFEHFGPYHVARIRGAISQMQVVPIELFGRCSRYAWAGLSNELDIPREILFENREPTSVSSAEVRRKLCELLPQLNLDVLAVHGWSLPGSVAAIQWAASESVPVVVMSESKADDRPRFWAKERVKKAVLADVSAGLVGGNSHSEYLVQLGLPRDSIFSGYDAVDNNYFGRASALARTEQSKYRRQYDLPEKYFFSSNRFIEKKNLGSLIAAFGQYVQKVEKPWELVLAGDGPLRHELEQQVEQIGLRGQVHFPGFLQYEDLPSFYGLASAFVHVSTTEQWGLVVNEAAASGLPLIVSSASGCAPHLVDDIRDDAPKGQHNGFICDAQSLDSIEQSLIAMTRLSGELRGKMSGRSIEIVNGFGPDQFGVGLRDAAQYAVKNRRNRTALDGILSAMMK